MKDIIIDLDPGIDDAFALIVALNTPIFNIKMLSSVSGNVPLKIATKNLLHLLEISKLSIPVYMGAKKPLKGKAHHATEIHQKTGLGNYTFNGNITRALKNSVEAMYQTLISSPKKISLVALGPLTNIALLFKKHPEVLKKIKEFIFMGSSIYGKGNVTDFAEFNTFCDPHALKFIIDLNIPMTIIPMELGQQKYFSPAKINKIKSLNKAGEILEKMFSGYNLLPGEVSKTGSITNHDLCAIAYAFDKTIFKTQKSKITVSLNKKTYGQTFITPHKNGNVTLCLDAYDKKLFEYACGAVSKSVID